MTTVLAFGGPVFALSGTLFFVQFFFLKFATDVLLIAPAVVGTLFALGRAWDAITITESRPAGEYVMSIKGDG